MKSDRRQAPVAIVGGGFSGTMTAAQLARRGIGSVLIDGSDRMGRGVAYATRQPAHLLNVCSEVMSAWPEAPSHFADWLGDDGSSYAARRDFGRYLGEQLDGTDGVIRIEDQAVGAERAGDGWTVRLANGEPIAASALVLAIGNQPPAPLPGTEDLPPDLFVDDPWSEAGVAAVARVAAAQGRVLILGTGLTMVDTVLSLDAAGHRGPILAISRRGLLPRSHVSPADPPTCVAPEEVPLGRVMTLWRWLRRRSAEVGFRAAVDALRPHSHAVWQSLPPDERRRFLRHAQPWWSVHRHRIAPEVGGLLDRLNGEGRLVVGPGRLRRIVAEGNELVADFAARDGTMSQVRAAAAFNCTGPLGRISATADPLLRSLLDTREVREDGLAIGLDIDERDRAGGRLWALGPLTKGRYWEMIAVPDIRGQAAAVAEDIAAELKP